MKLELTLERYERFLAIARELRIPPEELAKAAITQLINEPPDSIRAFVQEVLGTNAELYRRLGRA